MKLLHIDSSILGDNSASRQLSSEVVKAWQGAEAGTVVTYRDLAADAISHFPPPPSLRPAPPPSCAMPRNNTRPT